MAEDEITVTVDIPDPTPPVETDDTDVVVVTPHVEAASNDTAVLVEIAQRLARVEDALPSLAADVDVAQATAETAQVSADMVAAETAEVIDAITQEPDVAPTPETDAPPKREHFWFRRR